MIRDISKVIKVMKYIEVEENVTKEKIISVLHHPDQKMLKVDISLINSSDVIVGERTAIIKDDNYALLFSNSDIFEIGKIEGAYRERDLWKMIDKVSTQ